MKASELIAELQKAMAEHGDLPVCWEAEGHTIPCNAPTYVKDACLYDHEAVARAETVARLMVSWYG